MKTYLKTYSPIKLKTVFATVALCLGAYACATSPTGIMQLKLFPDEQMNQMGIAAYSEMKKQTPVTQDGKTSRYVNCIADAIIAVLPEKAEWEVNVFADDQVNAFALPGRKIGVYTGLLKVANNQSQLAAVMGHEVAHVLADHGNARVSANYAAQAGVTIATIIGMASTNDPQKRQLLGLLGVGVQVGALLPYGRAQESEADIIGLELMAKAGFDPRQSVILWQNMAKAGGSSSPEFLSTHTSSNTRIKNLSARMNKAVAWQQQAHANGRKPQCRR